MPSRYCYSNNNNHFSSLNTPVTTYPAWNDPIHAGDLEILMKKNFLESHPPVLARFGSVPPYPFALYVDCQAVTAMQCWLCGPDITRKNPQERQKLSF